ncbi:hypothetical protein LQR30_08710 [Chromobacterium piscinae]|uniref:hypothetical protein n=1 Tax=Chromobacterium piscinae TaxID=686831 RepID=UPI001E4B354C|nr:hypothetical protein [Chromobacterium piscinae]MCD4504184.1 hypothetical protein [Chromobacterium piscinae]
MQFDPRTVAREISGIFDEIFPQLTPGIVAHFNAASRIVPVQSLCKDLLQQSALQRSMLFELGYIVGERLLKDAVEIDWSACFAETVRRQRVYFDAKLPEQLEPVDQHLAETVGRNLAAIMTSLSASTGHSIVFRPPIPGLEWIASGYGDFALGATLVEVKCTARRFSSADYRQVAIYWLLSFAAAVEGHGKEWENFVLLNPRSGEIVTMAFDAFLSIISSGRTKVDILQLFLSLVGSRLTR